MQRHLFQTARSDFARLIARKFAPARLLLVGSEAGQIAEQWRQDQIDITSCPGVADVDAMARQRTSRFDVAIWFYPPESIGHDDTEMLDRLANIAQELVLLPAAGADVAKRRPPLVQYLGTRGFFPDYACDIVEIETGAIRLCRKNVASADALVPAVETGFARVNAQLRGLHRTLRTRMSELEAADRHIARLEEKVLKLKQAKRELKQLKAEKQALRKSPERKVGQVLLAPYRLPQKLIREVRKQFRGLTPERKATVSPNEYQHWLQQRRPSEAELSAARERSWQFSYRPLISIITPFAAN